jgi:hypothetical protein
VKLTLTCGAVVGFEVLRKGEDKGQKQILTKTRDSSRTPQA